MNIFLLNPPFKGKFSREQRSPAITKSGTLYYPMWLSYAAGVLEENGFNIKLIDAPADGITLNEIIDTAKNFNPQFIVIDTSTPSIYNDIKVGEILKDEIKDCVIALVGPHVSATPEETLNISKKIDIVCRGEYDYIVLDIAKNINNFEKIKGISYSKNGKIFHNEDASLIENLDELPFVSKVYRKHLNYKNYFYAHSRYPIVTIIGGRGCAHKCIYCVYPQTFSGRRIRYRSIENIIEEIEFIIKEFKELKEVMFEDDTLTLNKKRCREFCEKIMNRGIRFNWSCNSRADVDYETLKIMKEAGCRLLCVGFESGSQEILDNIHKNIKIEQMEEFMHNAKKVGILIHGCFMYGNPGETKETMKKTLEFAKKLNPDTAQFFPIMVYPGTEIYNWAKSNGYLKTNNYEEWVTSEGLHNCVVDFNEITSEYLVKFCDRSRKEFYLRPQYIGKKFIQMIKNPSEIKRTIKSLSTFAKHLLK